MSGDVVSTLTCTWGKNRSVGRKEEEVLKPQRALPVEEKFRGEEAEVVAGGREVKALFRPVLQEGARDELRRAVTEGGQDVTGADIRDHQAEPVKERISERGGRGGRTR